MAITKKPLIPPWTYKNKKITALPDKVEAFVYLITFEDGTKYVGKKNATSTQRKKVPGQLRRKVVVQESNWRDYLSSSAVVKDKITAGDKIKKREIIHMCYSKGEATYMEVVEMILRNVLCDPLYLNKNILSRFFKCYDNI